VLCARRLKQHPPPPSAFASSLGASRTPPPSLPLLRNLIRLPKRRPLSCPVSAGLSPSSSSDTTTNIVALALQHPAHQRRVYSSLSMWICPPRPASASFGECGGDFVLGFGSPSPFFFLDAFSSYYGATMSYLFDFSRPRMSWAGLTSSCTLHLFECLTPGKPESRFGSFPH
jgi:hypothetical protein